MSKPPYTKRKYSANLLGRFVGSRLRKRPGRISISLKLINEAVRQMLSFPQDGSLSSSSDAIVDSLMRQTRLWHGTGRYQYRDGKRVDILAYIVSHNKLQPQLDSWDFAGPMTTLSLAPSRMYARAYADMHGRGAAEPGRYGSSLFWAAVFVGDMKFEGIIESQAWTPAKWRLGREHIAKNTELWYRKISSAKLTTMEAFYQGSDIPGNYPIVFGIRGDYIEPAVTTRTVALHEVRALNSLRLSRDVTYLEVPRDQIKPVQSMLAAADYNFPVLAIEDCEQYMAQKSFTDLMANEWSPSRRR